MRIPLVGPSDSLDVLAAAAAECLNLYPEPIEDPQDQAKNAAMLRLVPGVHLFASLGGLGARIRCLWSGGGRLFVVSGNNLVEVSQGSYAPGNPSTGAGAVVSTNALAGGIPNSNPAQMFGNGNQLGIIANQQFFYDNGAGPVAATFATGGNVTALTGAYLDNTAYVQRPNGGSPDLGRQVNFSAVNDFTSWDALDFKQKEVGPDYIQAIFADREQLYVFGTETSEVWQNDSTTGLPQRIPGAAAREGCPARFGVASLAQSVFFLGGSPRGNVIAYRLRGFTPERISTPAVEAMWSSAASFSPAATAYPYISSTGHQFYMVNFLNPTNTWVYDVTASEKLGYHVWHQRAKWNSGGAFFDVYPYWFHTFIPEWGAGGMHIVGDVNSGNLYEMSDSYWDENGGDIHWRRTLPYRYGNSKRVFFGRQDMQAVGAAISREYSDDNGATWSAAQPEMGNGTTRRFWPTGGSTNAAGRIWRYSGHGQVQTALIDLQADETPGIV